MSCRPICRPGQLDDSGSRASATYGPSTFCWRVAVAAAGVAAYLVVGQSAASSQTTTRTADVTRGVVLSTVSATGTLQPSTELSIGFPTSGVISSVNVKAGQRVRRGQLLGRLDSLSAQQSTQQAEASLASAQAQYEQTLTGETAAQRAQDAVGAAQARASIATAKTALSAAKKAVAARHADVGGERRPGAAATARRPGPIEGRRRQARHGLRDAGERRRCGCSRRERQGRPPGGSDDAAERPAVAARRAGAADEPQRRAQQRPEQSEDGANGQRRRGDRQVRRRRRRRPERARQRPDGARLVAEDALQRRLPDRPAPSRGSRPTRRPSRP